MVDKKYFLVIILAIKYLVLLNYMPLLETTRYITFFEQCSEFGKCLNPYSNIQLLEKSYLTFPYSNFMYFVLLPFFYIGKLVSLSFINLSYLFFEVVMIYTLKKIFNFSEKNLFFILVFNPLFIYSIGILGQLDFIPLSFFVISLYYLKEKKKYFSIFFIILSLSSKIIFIILLPLIILYFLKLDENIKESSQTIMYTFFLILFLNFQFFIDKNYLDTIFFGINRGYSVINSSTNIFSNNFLFILLFITFTLFLYWKNIHRLDFIGVSVFTGFITFPIYITNLSNIGWLLWTFPALLILFFSYEIKVKSLLIVFFLLLVISNEENDFIELQSNIEVILNYFIYSISTIIIYYLFQIISKNLYFKIKSRPIILSIAGDSAVGKSTLAALLEDYFGSKFVDKVELDSFHLYERDNPEWSKKTHLNPEMNDLSSFKKLILNLLNGETQIVKNYNHLTGKFDSNDKKSMKDYLIIEGLHSLYFSDLNKLYDLKIFLDLKDRVKDEAKLIRDKERQKDEEDILNEIENRKSDYIKYVLPQADKADLYISTQSRDDDLHIEINIKSEYLVDLKKIFTEESIIKIYDAIEVKDSSKVQIKIKSIDIKNTFHKLTREIDNLSSMKFEVIDTENLAEQYLKLGLVLFLLNKKIQLR